MIIGVNFTFIEHISIIIIDICHKICYTEIHKKQYRETLLMNYLTYLTVFDKLTKSQQDTLTSSAFVRKFSKTLQRHIGALHRTRNGKRKADAKK